MSSVVQSVAVDLIDLSKTESQVMRRKSFDRVKLEELGASLKSQGLINPVLVRPSPLDGDRFELVAGERRLLATKAIGQESILAIVRPLSDEAVLELQLVENLQREGLHPMQEAEGYAALLRDHNKTADDVAVLVGKSRTYVYGRIKLLALCKELRKAFYAGKFSESVALVLARIPSDADQRAALKELMPEWRGDEPPTYREALRVVQQRFMLRLASAQFPTDDATLVAGVPACGTCPKRTGNSPDLFSDVGDADLCTDSSCFATKLRAFGSRQLEAARERGLEVIAGDAAKKVAAHGLESVNGFRRLDREVYVDGKYRKVKSVVGKGAPVVVIEDPKTGLAAEFVKEETFKAAAKEKGFKNTDPGSGGTSYSQQQTAERKRVLFERRFRDAVYAEVRTARRADKKRTPLVLETMISLLSLAYAEMWHEKRERVRKLWDGVDLSGDRAQVHAALAKMSLGDLDVFALDLLMASDLMVSSYNKTKPALLLAAAKAADVDVAKVRAALKAPKKKPAAAKGKAKKKGAK